MASRVRYDRLRAARAVLVTAVACAASYVVGWNTGRASVQDANDLLRVGFRILDTTAPEGEQDVTAFETTDIVGCVSILTNLR